MKKFTLLVLLIAALCNFPQPACQFRSDIGGGGGGTTVPPKGGGPTIRMNPEGIDAEASAAY